MLFRFSALLTPALLLLVACSPTPDHPATVPPPAEHGQPTETERFGASEAAAPPDTVRTFSARRRISDLGAPDVFRLRVLGDSLLTAPVEFTIHSASGQELYRQRLAPGTLEAALTYELAGVAASPAQRTAYVRRRLTHFFADSCFSTPAVKPAETYVAGFVARPVWETLRRPGTVEFRYLAGKEDGHRLAWVASARKVVRFAGFGG